MNVVVLVCDHLPAGFVGAYGNTWLDTPEFDRLAAESFLADFAFAPSLDFGRLYPGILWHGRHPLELPPMDRVPPSLPRLFDLHGHHTVLATDDRSVLAAGETEFVEVVSIDDRREGIVDRWEDTHAAHFFAEACDALAALQQDAPWRPYLLWLHTRCCAPPWDAPKSLREKFREDDGETTSDKIGFTGRELPADFDPDERLDLQRAFGAQVQLLDTGLGALAELIREPAVGEPPLFVVLGARGVGLGEHRRLGVHPGNLDGEQLHVPLLIRSPDGEGACLRTPALLHLADLAPSLAARCGLPNLPFTRWTGNLFGTLDGTVDRLRDYVVCTTPSRWSLRTRDWFADLPQPGTLGSTRLFAKPDDRWEINDVSGRCAPVLDDARKLAEEIRTALADPAAPLPSAPPSLLRGSQ